MNFIVAIDGPAGTGKSTVAKSVAKKLGLLYVNTGAIYRSLAFLADKYDVEDHDISGLLKLIKKITVEIDQPNFRAQLIVDGEKVHEQLQKEDIGTRASNISQHKEVRQGLLKLQKSLASLYPKGMIFEGRDIGTVVFPNAQLKLYFYADAKTRGQRRLKEMLAKGEKVTLDDIVDAIKKRDEKDENRLNSPLKKASDAIFFDTTPLTQKEVEEKMLGLVKKSLLAYKKG